MRYKLLALYLAGDPVIRLAKALGKKKLSS